MPFVAFELLDTLCDFEKAVCQIESILNKQHDICIGQQRASRFFFNWYNSALRDHIATSFAGKYCPLRKVLEATLLRALYHEGFEDIVDEAAVIGTLEAIKPSINAFTALELLKDKGWDIWVLSTSGTREETLEFLKRMGFLNYIDSQNILCCDDLRVSRPHPRVYSELMRLAVHQTKRIENFYFVGSYAFDIASAKNMSLKTVYLDTREKIYTKDMYNNGTPDVVGNNLVDCVQKMIQYENLKKTL